MKSLRKFMILILFALLMTSGLNVSAAKIKLSSTKLYMGVTATRTLKVKGTEDKVKWSSSKKSVATVDSKGKVTARKAGKATITAKVGNKSYACKVEVVKPVLKQKKITMKVDDTGIIELKRYCENVKWSSSNEQIVKIEDDYEDWIFVKGIKEGSATITAKVGKKKLTCKVIVTKGKTPEQPDPIPAKYIDVSSSDVILKVGDSIDVNINSSAKILIANSADTNIVSREWKSVANAGYNYTLTLKALKPGKTYVHIEDNEDFTNYKDIQVDVPEPEVLLSASASEIEMTYSVDTQKQVDITLQSNLSIPGSLQYSIKDTSIVSCSLGDSLNCVTPLYINPRKIGSTTITITNTLNSAVININVTVKSPVTINIPVLPKNITDRRYSYSKTCKITGIRTEFVYESGNLYQYKLYLDGEKIYDGDSATTSSMMGTGYKLYRMSDNAVVESGIHVIPALFVGDKFAEDYFYLKMLAPGEYRLELLDVV